MMDTTTPSASATVVIPHLDGFSQYLRVERRYSALTVEHYRRDLSIFYQYCQRQRIDRWQDVNDRDVRAFIAGQRQSDLSVASIARRLSTLRSFYRYLLAEKVCTVNPAEGIRAPKGSKKLPQTLTIEAVGRLIDEHSEQPLAVRDRLVVELIYGCGLRVSELVSLDCDQLDREDRSLRVVGKGQKMRVLPMGRKTCDAVALWLSIRRQWLKASDNTRALLISQRGRRLTVRSVQLRLKQLAQQRGLEQSLHPHMLRHSFASHLLESSGSLLAVQSLLGHADISTTQIYTHLDYQYLSSLYDKSHPRSRRKTRSDTH